MRVLVADPVTIFRTGVRNLLRRESDFEVVEASSCEEAELRLEAGCPEIALIDLDLPPKGGVDAVRLLSERCNSYLIVWSFDPTPQAVLAAVRAGADGFLHKQISPPGLVRSLRGVMHGEAPLSRDLTMLMVDAIHGSELRDQSRARLAVLSAREREILEHVALGARNRQIAATLTISEFTVKRHVQNILSKLEVGSRRAASDYYVAARAEIAGSRRALMTAAKRQPLVAFLYSVPLLHEALLSTLDSIADVQAFPAGRGDVTGLLRSVKPDAIVVDDADEADEARSWAKRHHAPLVHICLRDQKIRVLRNGGWDETAGAGAETIRNVLAGSLYGRGNGS